MNDPLALLEASAVTAATSVVDLTLALNAMWWVFAGIVVGEVAKPPTLLRDGFGAQVAMGECTK